MALQTNLNKKDKITIISTELYEKDIANIDEAIWGRIHERCGSGKYWFTITNDVNKNYRAKTIQ